MRVSFLNQWDARVKLFLMLIGALGSVVFSNLLSLGIVFAATLVLAVLVKRLKLLSVLYLMMLAMAALALTSTCVMAFLMGKPLQLGWASLILPFIRGSIMMNLVLVLALSTKIEEVMLALVQLKLPFVLTLPATVMIRFIPTFTNDVTQVWEALKIRGWAMNWKMLCFHPILSSRLIFIPILFRALKSGEALGVAAELKGLDRGLSFKAKSNFLDSSQTYSNNMAIWGVIVLVLLTAIAFEFYPPSWLPVSPSLGMF